jgi:hypothetical protein
MCCATGYCLDSGRVPDDRDTIQKQQQIQRKGVDLSATAIFAMTSIALFVSILACTAACAELP